jgi:predicted RNA-binding protein with PIN domain
MLADSADGIESMLRSPEVLLVIDGYNVSQRAWPDATPADQRERLGIATTALSRRLGCEVLIVFDGDGSGAVRPPLRRGSVRVVFSDADEEADEVVVRSVAELPKRIPAVVASSDAWVREHAQREGAVVIPAPALLSLLR